MPLTFSLRDLSQLKTLVPRWHLFLFVILVLGSLVRFTGFDFQLPYRYVAKHDETHLFADTLVHRGLLGDTQLMWPGYPPGIFVVDGAAQLIAEKITGQSFWDVSNSAVALIRFCSALAGVITGLFVALLVKIISDDISSLLVTALWLALPNPNFQTVREMPMVWVLLFTTISFYLTIASLIYSRRWLALMSVAVGLLAVTFRYSEALVLVPAVLVTVWHIRKKEQKWIKVLFAQMTLIAFYFGVGWVIYGHVYDTPESTHLGVGIAGLFNWATQQPILEASIRQIGLSPAVFIAITIIGTLVLVSQSKHFLENQIAAWLLIGGYGVLSAIFIEVYLNFDVLIPRYITPVSVPFTILAGVGIVKIVKWIGDQTAPKWVVSFALCIVTCFWLVPPLTQSIQLDIDRMRPDTHAAVINWSAAMLGEGSILVDADNNYIFSKIYGGYTGSYRVYIKADLTSHTIAEWQAEDVNYAVFSGDVVAQLQKSAPNYLSQLLLLNQFPPEGSTENWQNSPEYVFRLAGIQYPRRDSFVNGIAFKGYDLSGTLARRGDNVKVVLYWNAKQKPMDNYNVFVHLVSLSDDTKLVTQFDGPPAGTSRPTLSWTNPSETLISPIAQLTIPESTPPGCYQLVIGLYNYETGYRLPLSTGQTELALTHVCVNAAEF